MQGMLYNVGSEHLTPTLSFLACNLEVSNRHAGDLEVSRGYLKVVWTNADSNTSIRPRQLPVTSSYNNIL
jgi:hypothetical protein